MEANTYFENLPVRRFLVKFTNEIYVQARSEAEAKSRAQDAWIKNPPDPKITVIATSGLTSLN